MQTANEYTRTHQGTNTEQNTFAGRNAMDVQGIPSLRPFRRPLNELEQQLEDLEDTPE